MSTLKKLISGMAITQFAFRIKCELTNLKLLTASRIVDSTILEAENFF